jgi:hypothetical protein
VRAPSRRRRRPNKQRLKKPRDVAVLRFFAEEEGQFLVLGPFTRQGALAVLIREASIGRKVQLVPYERVRALVEAPS